MLLVGIQNSTVIENWFDNLKKKKKDKLTSLFWPSKPTPKYLPKRNKNEEPKIDFEKEFSDQFYS